MEPLISETRQKMQKALEHLLEELLAVRSGRAVPSLLESIKVSVYGSQMALKEVASISAPEPRLLIVQPWDQNNVDPISKAIRDANMGFNPIVETNLIRVAVPALNEERRADLIKVVSEKGESARVSIRAVRREALESIQKDEKSGKLSKDDARRASENIQKVTDELVGEVDKVVKSKELELREI